MRHTIAGFAAAVILAVVPTLVTASNQEIADQIVRRLRDSGRMSDYSVGVTYKDGTARLHGRVASEQQMATALKVAFQTPGVASVINELVVAPSEAGQNAAPSGEASASRNPLRNRNGVPVAEDAQRQKASLANADRVPNSYSSPAEVQTVSAEEMQREAPEKMPMPQRVKPMGTARVAMSQAPVRGPAASGGPLPMYAGANGGGGPAPARYDQPCLPNYAWPSYAAYPNYAAVTYPKQYSPTAWPYIGPFYPYPQVPLGWRKVTLEWDDGWWFLDFKDQPASCWHR
jgi:hypothetical protein